MSGLIINRFINEAGGLKIADCVLSLAYQQSYKLVNVLAPACKDGWNCRGGANGWHSVLTLALIV